MSYAYAIQPPAGFGLLRVPTIGMRKRAWGVPQVQMSGDAENAWNNAWNNTQTSVGTTPALPTPLKGQEGDGADYVMGSDGKFRKVPVSSGAPQATAPQPRVIQTGVPIQQTVTGTTRDPEIHRRFGSRIGVNDPAVLKMRQERQARIANREKFNNAVRKAREDAAGVTEINRRFGKPTTSEEIAKNRRLRAEMQANRAQQSQQGQATSNQAAVTPQNTQAPPAVNQPYGLANRFSDIWSFIKNMWTMLRYRSGAQAGSLNANEWKEFQDAATGLGNNRTFKDLHTLWYGDRAAENWKKWEGLGNFTKALPTMYRVKDAFARQGNNGGGWLQNLITKDMKLAPGQKPSSLRNGWYGIGKPTLPEGVTWNDVDQVYSQIPYALKHGYMSRRDYDNLPTIFRNSIPYPEQQQ